MTPWNRPQRNRIHRLPHRLLAVGLVAGVSTVGMATAAQAAPTTIQAGRRAPVQVAHVDPAALPASFEPAASRRTSVVTVAL